MKSILLGTAYGFGGAGVEDRRPKVMLTVQAPAFTIPTDSLTQPQLRNYGRRNWDIGFVRNQPIGERFSCLWGLGRVLRSVRHSLARCWPVELRVTF